MRPRQTAIEAEAIKSLAPELEVLDRMLMTLEVRRNRSRELCQAGAGGSDRVIEAESFRRLTDDQVSA